MGQEPLGLRIQWEREMDDGGGSSCREQAIASLCVEVRDILDLSPDILCPIFCCPGNCVLLCGCINWDQQLLEG